MEAGEYLQRGNGWARLGLGLRGRLRDEIDLLRYRP